MSKLVYLLNIITLTATFAVSANAQVETTSKADGADSAVAPITIVELDFPICNPPFNMRDFFPRKVTLFASDEKCSNPKEFGKVDGGGATVGSDFDVNCSAVSDWMDRCIAREKKACTEANGSWYEKRRSECIWVGKKADVTPFCSIQASAQQVLGCVLTGEDYKNRYKGSGTLTERNLIGR